MGNHWKSLIAGVGLTSVLGVTGAGAQGLIVSPNNTTQIGINDNGSLDTDTSAGFVGLGYNFTGQGGRTGFQDALTPGCACEAWGVSANGIGGQVGDTTGNDNIGVNPSSTGAGTFTSSTYLLSLPGVTVTQTYSLSNENASGALFVDSVVIHNGTGAEVTDLRYTRAMDWDVPPTEFAEYTTFVGTGTTSTLLRSTDNGFASANPLTAVSDPGIDGPIDADGTTGPDDHGALFTFGFGNLADGADYKFNIYYGAAADQAGALGLLSAVGPELYNLGQSSYIDGGGEDGPIRTDLPTYVFAFNGVGGTVVVPSSGVPEPSTWAMLLLGFAGLGFAGYRSQKKRYAGLVAG
jgi:hypothetical protein